MISEKPNAVKNVRGFSLIECLVATVLFTISCLGIFSLYQQQILATRSLLSWHDAKNEALEKAHDLHAQALRSFSGMEAITNDVGGALAAGEFAIDGDGGMVNMQRHWRITDEKRDPLPLKLATVSVTFSHQGVSAVVEQRVILWDWEKHKLPPVAAFNPGREQ